MYNCILVSRRRFAFFSRMPVTFGGAQNDFRGLGRPKSGGSELTSSDVGIQPAESNRRQHDNCPPHICPILDWGTD